MTTTHASSLVCIRKENSDVVGTGFLVDEQHILTCAHVVAEAFEWSRGEFSPDPPQELVHLDFPLLAHNTMLTARVAFWQPAGEDWSGGDIAGLQLMTDAPVGAEPVRFALAEDVWDHDFRVFGFPSGQDNGVWATGRLLDRQASNWIQIEDNKTGGFAVIPGFSGGAVWDEQLGGVVGMVVAAIVQPETKVAFVIPLDVLLAAWSLIKPITRQRVFLSAAPADTPHMTRLRADLEASGILVWDEQHGPAGRNATPERVRQQAIRAALALVVIVSSRTPSSLLVREHLRLAELYQRRQIFVWMSDEERTPERGRWRDLTWVDAHGPNYATGLQAIGEALSERTSITGLLDALNEPAWEPRNPYIGLRAFTAQETKDFFGRERFIEQLHSDIQKMLKAEPQTNEQRRLLTVIGPSGSGKSSVVMAGLLPQLMQSDDSKSWVYLNPMVPGKDPIEALVDTLSPHFPNTSFKTQRENLEGDTTNGLHRLAKQLAAQQERITDQKTRVILFIDQFEELFTLTVSKEQRRRFLDLLQTAVTEPEGPLLVLLTLRADFYHRLMEHSEFYKLIEPTLKPLLPLEIEELRATIEYPAAQSDVQLFFEGNLVGDLLFEIQGQAGTLPLLQFTLQQLFERRNGHRLTQHAYKEIGKVSGALSKYADETYEHLSKEQQPLARVLFLHLLEPGASEQDTTRRRAALTEFAFDDQGQTHLMQKTMDIFVKARLLTTNANESAGTTSIEVSHEALIREWPLLAGWLREARGDIRLQQTINKDVAEWEQHNKPGDRLYRGSQLREAQAWARRNIPSSNEVAFLRAGAAYRVRSLVRVIAVLLLVVSSTGIAGWFYRHRAPDFTLVTSLQDDGMGSLRWAITNAPLGSTITFDASLRGRTILLTSDDLNIGRNLTIQGPEGAPQLIISAGNSTPRVRIRPHITVTISNLSFQDNASDYIVTNDGTLFLSNCSVMNNRGGGISNYEGTMTVAHSIISGNTTLGGAVSNVRGILKFLQSTVSYNITTGAAGGIVNDTGTLVLKESKVMYNMAVNGVGGGISNTGTLELEKSLIEHNTAMSGGGVFNTALGKSGVLTRGIANITNSSILQNTAKGNGGGIANAGGTVTLVDSSIAGNAAPAGNGGGISNFNLNDLRSHFTLVNSTVSGNQAAYVDGFGGYGGGIFNQDGRVDITFCTIYGNKATIGGGGVGAFRTTGSSFQVVLQASIVARNNASTGPNILGSVKSLGYNLLTKDTSTSISRENGSVDIIDDAFQLPALQQNGGSTLTHALPSNSSARNRIPYDVCLHLHVSTDQRGVKRPQEAGCDIGAYQYATTAGTR